MRWTEEEYAAYEARRRAGDGNTAGDGGIARCSEHRETTSPALWATSPDQQSPHCQRQGRPARANPPDSSAALPALPHSGVAPVRGRGGKGFEPNRRGAFALAPALIGREPHARPTKYGNRRVEIDGKKFDSKHEAEVYGELMLRQRAGELKLVLRQVPFELPGGIKYIADFVTMDHAGNIEVIDAKSEITRKNRVYINKKKQMASEWGIEIKEV